MRVSGARRTAAARSWPTAQRVLLATGLLVPIGFLMGALFPLGMRLASRGERAPIAGAWPRSGMTRYARGAGLRPSCPMPMMSAAVAAATAPWGPGHCEEIGTILPSCSTPICAAAFADFAAYTCYAAQTDGSSWRMIPSWRLSARNVESHTGSALTRSLLSVLRWRLGCSDEGQRDTGEPR